ncbi:unnamed protein product [Blepharisma stoltei]|uniref:Uncharacterized protein n=1 Tax=Blepharisma stoltei TaxID=1481888 RepID=A0AAU9JT81_9CILI|nr:unnamed protein product [Blepharisma stoltei]
MAILLMINLDYHKASLSFSHAKPILDTSSHNNQSRRVSYEIPVLSKTYRFEERSYTTQRSHRSHFSQDNTLQFSTTPRFDEGFLAKYNWISPVIKRKTKEERKSLNERIRKNKDMTVYVPVNKEKAMRETFRKKWEHLEITKRAHSAILKEVKQQKQEAWVDKFRRYDMRVRKDEAKQLKVAWAVLYSSLGAAWVVANLIKNRWRLHKRAEKSLTWLKGLSRAVGKIIMVLKEIRRKRSIRVLKLRFIFHLKCWLIRRRKRYLRMKVSLFEKVIAQYTFLQLMSKWKQAILKIQRIWKRCLVSSRLLNLKLLEKWNKAEIEDQKRQPESRTKKRKKTQTNRVVRATRPPEKEIIPEYVKILYIREFKKDKIKKHTLDWKFYRQGIEIFMTLNVSQWRNEDEEAQKPPAPINFYEEFTNDIINDCILKAQAEKILWKTMAETEENNIRLSRMENLL